MTKNPSAQGETKSAPKELPKLPRYRCVWCGIEACAPTVDLIEAPSSGRCRNTAACEKRLRRNTRATKSEREHA